MTERDEEMIRGTVQSIIFQNSENGYTVLRLRAEDGNQDGSTAQTEPAKTEAEPAQAADEAPYSRELTPLPETLPSYDSGKTLTAQEVYGMNVDAVCGIATAAADRQMRK